MNSQKTSRISQRILFLKKEKDKNHPILKPPFLNYVFTFIHFLWQQGEEQKKLDVLSNEVFIKALVSSGRTVSCYLIIQMTGQISGDLL